MLAIPLFPFWKVRKIIRDHHPDIWAHYGPFDLQNLLATAEIQKNFFRIVALGGEDVKLKSEDARLATWLRICREVWAMAPQSFGRQVLYFALYLFFVGTFTSTIVSWFQ